MKAAPWFAVCCLAVGLGAPALAQHVGSADLVAMPATKPARVEAYGRDALQFGQLRLPKGKGPFPVAILIHGGCWTKGYATLSYLSPLAADLAAKGVATWNIEYRQVGDVGGGWPGSFLDWAAGTDWVRELAKTYPLDLSRVVVAGHSAGAHAALWVASRGRLGPTSPVRGGSDPLSVRAAVAIDGPGDLAALIPREMGICGKPVIENVMGGSPKEVPDRYAQGSPIALLPVAVDERLVASVVLTPAEAEDYKRAAADKHEVVSVTALKDAGHFDMLSPASASGGQVEHIILDAVGLASPKE